ncbi:MAG: TilS substrate-binding domain-containing protein, partial [Akkermansia sp.]
RYLSLGGVPDISSELIDAIAAILPADAAAARVNLPGGGWAARRQGRLVLLSPAGEPRAVPWQNTDS